jgi:hypothetical protein
LSGHLKLDVKGLASYITSSNDSALVFRESLAWVVRQRVKGILAAHLSNIMPAWRMVGCAVRRRLIPVLLRLNFSFITP